jgi:hypothetical protein
VGHQVYPLTEAETTTEPVPVYTGSPAPVPTGPPEVQPQEELQGQGSRKVVLGVLALLLLAATLLLLFTER